MTTSRKLACHPRLSRLSVEPLEDRFLLSSLPLPLVAHAEAASLWADVRAIQQGTSSDHVQILEFTPVERDEETQQEIVVEELPKHIVSAVRDRLPGARLLAAEMDRDSGLLVFGVSAELNGVDFDLTLSPAGVVLEIEQAVLPKDLPAPVQNWIATHFPDASIREAELVTGRDTVSYELVIDPPGDQGFEATLLVTEFTTTLSARGTTEVSDVNAASSTVLHEDFDAGELGNEDQDRMIPAREDPPSATGTASSDQRLSPESTPSERPSPGPRDQADAKIASAQALRDELTVAGPVSRSIVPRDPFATTLRPVVSTIVQASQSIGLPAMAQVLDYLFPRDMAAIEQGLLEFLDEVGSLADQFSPKSESGSSAFELLIAISALLAAERVIGDMTKTVSDPVLAAVGGDPTGTWGLDLPLKGRSNER